MRRIGAAAFLVVLLVGTGCGGRADSASPRAPTQGNARPVELELHTPDGRVFETVAFRGAPTLLFLFATFDGVSQAALIPLREFVDAHPNFQVIGVAVQPNPKLLVDAWQHALEPPFLVTYDDEEEIATGKTALGELEAIPTFVMLDAGGHEVARHVGMASLEELEALRRRAER